MSIHDPNRSITYAEALMWLNDRLGCPVNVNITVGVGDHSHMVILADSGTLQHWSKNNPDPHWAGQAREDIAGLYDTGPIAIDLTNLDCTMRLEPPVSAELRERAIKTGLGQPGETLIIDLGENVQMRVSVVDGVLR